MNSSVGPPVKCGYCGWLIQGCNNIIMHKCLEHYNEYIHYLKVDDNFVVTLIPRPDATQNAVSTQDPATTEIVSYRQTATEGVDNDPNFDERLIDAVSERPALYNIRLPVKDRTKLKMQSLWLEVSNVLGGTTPEDAKKRWQYLRDCYIKDKNKQLKYVPSGSAADPSKKTSFRFYERMRFISDQLPNTESVSNLAEPQSPQDSGRFSLSPQGNVELRTVLPGPSSTSSTTSYTSIRPERHTTMSPTPPPRTPTPGSKKRKTDDSNASVRSALLTALQQPVPQPDAVDGILMRLGEGLRRLPYRERAALEIKFLTLLMEAEGRLNLPEVP
ncbi:uncharacterized protein LOC125500922 [Athalia rosae]|uniref:uncharacterized protein LOC105684849 n=1 Tax=Athalia rosae TaxID=37344 RepID=UPI0006251BDF|nr:uncharacterized protein LOC105684849 [Athalia rosae]XP_012260790.1 uncharacterized protein LOC105688816 [Athalia rosae]XP_048511093.1 uncharacterized protein LOC125500922 [Athalia rosae]